jgi:hypothetical protein
MMARNADYLDQNTFAHLMKPWLWNSMWFFLSIDKVWFHSFDSIGVNPLMTAAVRTVFGCEPEQLNALFALTYAQAGGGFMRLTLTDPGCAQEKKIKV